MVNRTLILAVALTATAFAVAPQAAAPARNSAATPAATLADSMSAKLAQLSANGKSTPPAPRTTELSQQEANAYFAAGRLKLPAGVTNLRCEIHDGYVIGTANVDFDKIREGRHVTNPLLSMFTGVHDVRVQAYAAGDDGQAAVRISSASLDDVEIPRFVLDMFVKRFIQPKWPSVSLDTNFKMPAQIRTARLQEGKLVLQQ